MGHILIRPELSPMGLEVMDGMTSVADLGALSALNVGVAARGFPDGFVVFVATLLCPWRLVPGALPLDPMTVRASTDPLRQWHRLAPGEAGSANPWLSQLTWGIALAGNDQAAGTPADPLATLDEWRRRIAGAELNGAYTILCSRPLASVELDVAIGNVGSLVMDFAGGATTLVGPLTVGVYTGPVPATPQWAIITTTVPAFDWTPYRGKRCRIVTSALPANVGAIFWVAAEIPVGGGASNTARISLPVNATLSSAPPTLVAITPQGGDTFVVEDLVEVNGLVVNATKAAPTAPANELAVSIGNVRLAPAVGATSCYVSWNQPTPVGGMLYGSDLQAVGSIVGAGLVAGCHVGFSAASVQFLATGMAYYLAFDRCVFGHTPVTASLYTVRPYDCSFRDCLFETVQLWMRSGKTLLTGQHATFDTNGDAIRYNDCSASLDIESTACCGNANVGYGIHVEICGKVVRYVTKPTITGTLGDLRLTGTTVAWAGVPVFDAAHQSGMSPGIG